MGWSDPCDFFGHKHLAKSGVSSPLRCFPRVQMPFITSVSSVLSHIFKVTGLVTGTVTRVIRAPVTLSAARRPMKNANDPVDLGKLSVPSEN